MGALDILCVAAGFEDGDLADAFRRLMCADADESELSPDALALEFPELFEVAS